MSANPGILRWKGILADLNRRTRVLGFIMLILASGSLIFCQLGFVPVGGTRLLLVLVPVALGSLMYGALLGMACGAISGLAMMTHAFLLPVDYYEKYFASPINSVVLFALTGFLLGILFALVARAGNRSRAAGFIALIAACFVGSWFASTFFQISAYIIIAMLSVTLPPELLNVISGLRSIAAQLVLDAVAMSIACVAAGAINLRRINQPERERPLRSTFMGWLVVVVLIAFQATSAFAYTILTAGMLESANTALDNHLAYVSDHLKDRDEWANQIEQNGGLTPEQHKDMMAQSIESIATSLKLWETGITVVAENDTIVSSSIPDYIGESFASVIGKGVQGGFNYSLYSTDHPVEFYLENSDNGAEISYLKATQISYLRIDKTGDYQVAAILPGEEVFEGRTLGMMLISTVFLIQFLLVFALAMRLLDRVVVRSINDTNETLERITHGDLEQRVDVHDSSEFSSLSDGINTTVGALKDSIAEAETRMARELSTAKAIQANALPRTFPPFPEIERFDLFATMEPAREVGGDFYNFFLLDDNRLGLVMADVSGKGIPAALFMMAAKTELETCLETDMSLVEAMATANNHLCQGNDAGMFVTVFAAILNYETGELEYVNAGHNPPVIRQNGQWSYLREKSGLFLGAFETAKYKSYTIQLDEGDALLLYTDGVTEAMDPAEVLYGDDRLVAFLADHSKLHPRKLVESVRHDLRRWANGAEQADDITMLALEYGVKPEITASLVLPAKLDQLERAQRFVSDELAKRACPISVQNKVNICIEELFVNVANYAYPDAPENKPGRVRVAYTYHPEPRGVAIDISDEGIPFDPLAKEDPEAPSSIAEAKIGGLGIFMTKTIADDISYQYRDGCNVTTFTKLW